MDKSAVRVECYAGYKGDERPLRLHFGENEETIEVVRVEYRWYSPGVTFFRVVVDGGDRYILRNEDAQDTWALAGYRGAQMIDMKIKGRV